MFAGSLIANVFLSASMSVAQTPALGGAPTSKSEALSSSTAIVAGQLLSNLKVPNPSALKGYSAYRARVEILRHHVPVFALKLDQAENQRTWYSIPALFDPLPGSQTGLYFVSHPPAYQNDREVFVSALSLESLNATQAGSAIMEQMLMILQDRRDPVKVRLTNNAIFSERFAINDVQNILAENGFGVYFTDGQMIRIRQAAIRSYVGIMAAMTDIERVCSKDYDPIARSLNPGNPLQAKWQIIRAKMNALSGWIPKSEQELLEFKGPIDGPYRANDSEAIFRPMFGDNAFISPFRLNDYSVGLITSAFEAHPIAIDGIFSACLGFPSEFPEIACKRFRTDLKDYRSRRDQGSPQEINTNAAHNLALTLNENVGDDASEARMYLHRRGPSFATLIALIASEDIATEIEKVEQQNLPSLEREHAVELLSAALEEQRVIGSLRLRRKIQRVCDVGKTMHGEVTDFYDQLNREMRAWETAGQ